MGMEERQMTMTRGPEREGPAQPCLAVAAAEGSDQAELAFAGSGEVVGRIASATNRRDSCWGRAPFHAEDAAANSAPACPGLACLVLACPDLAWAAPAYLGLGTWRAGSAAGK